MRYRSFWIALPVGLALFALWFIMHSAQPCFACTTQPPTSCTSNLSAMTVRQNDERKAWWDFLDKREEQTLNVYLGLNYVNGTTPMSGTYEISVDDPILDPVIEPKQVTFVLQPAGERGSFDTQEITIPYGTITATKDLNITATLMDTNGACDLPPNLTSTVRINPTGPTVWPVVPRTCPVAGEKANLIFGLRNPSDTPQTYNVVARAVNPYGGTDSDLFNLNGQGDTANLGPFTLGPGKTEQIKLDCETFGYCMTSGENRVGLEVTPAVNSEQFTTAEAWSNVTISDPNTPCPVVKDWWFLMPPLVLAAIIGAIALPLLLGSVFAAYKLFYTPPPPPIRLPPEEQRPPDNRRPPGSDTGEQGVTPKGPRPPEPKDDSPGSGGAGSRR
jgi:hypothetical protein